MAAEFLDGAVVSNARHPDDADLVVFVEPQCRYQSDVMLSSMYRRYRDRAVVIDSQDNPVPLLPGLYTCLESRCLNDGRYKAGFYLRVADSEALDPGRWEGTDRSWLFSFLGKSANHRSVRDRVLALRHPRGLVQDAATAQSDGSMTYAETLARSKFVLAPRGIGVSTWRLFEAMRMGRCPVIISDEWVAPEGVDWNSCSIRIREAEVSRLPTVLEAREGDAVRLGRNAYSEWQRCFSKERAFEWVGLRLAECHQAAMKSSSRTGWMNLGGFGERLSFVSSAARSALAGVR